MPAIRIPKGRSSLLAIVAVAGLLAPRPCFAQTLPDKIQIRLKAWYQSAARSAPGKWAIAIANQDGDLLWSVRPDEPMIPASTVKLLTTGFARSVLGANARVATRVVGHGSVDPETGEWLGSWAIELNGDPSLERPTRGGPTLTELALQLSAQGIRRLRGPLEVTSESGTAGAVYPAAWSPKHWGRIFAPLVGAITLNENVVFVTVRPGRKIGSRALLGGTAPEGLDALVSVRATTVGGYRSRLSLTRLKDGGFLVTGRIGIYSGGRRMTSVAPDPRAVLAETWALALRRAGIEWVRESGDQIPPAPVLPPESPDSAAPVPVTARQVLAEVTSAPLDSLASEINRRSVNIGAELLLQWAAGRVDGPAQLTQHVEQVAGVTNGVRLVDGSGLSSEDRVTPATFISYLARFPETAAGRNFPMLLPANGQGTLARLRSGFPGPGVVHAKTGTLGDVSSLVGYLGRKDGVLLISLLYNGGRARTAKRHQWTLFRLLGADGSVIPTDAEESDEEPEQLGGEPSN